MAGDALGDRHPHTLAGMNRVEARITHTCLGIDGHQTVLRATVEHVAQVQVAVEQHGGRFRVQQLLAAPDGPVPRSDIDTCTDRWFGQPSAGPGEGLLAAPARHTRRRRRQDPVQRGEEGRPLPRKRSSWHVLDRCPGHDLLQHHCTRLLVDGQYRGHPPRNSEPRQHSDPFTQQGTIWTEYQHRRRAVRPLTPQRNRLTSIREGATERKSPTGRQPHSGLRESEHHPATCGPNRRTKPVATLSASTNMRFTQASLSVVRSLSTAFDRSQSCATRLHPSSPRKPPRLAETEHRCATHGRGGQTQTAIE